MSRHGEYVLTLRCTAPTANGFVCNARHEARVFRGASKGEAERAATRAG